MKHDAWRRQPETYPFSGEILPRYTDVDLWQHLNNVALVSRKRSANPTLAPPMTAC